MKRRAVGLALALMVITLSGAAMSLMGLHAARMMQRRQADRARSFAQVLLDSGITYVHEHRQRLGANLPAREVVLPTDGLLPAPAEGRLTLGAQDGGVIRVCAVVTFSRSRATEEIRIRVATESAGRTRPATSSASRPASSPAP